MPQFITVHSTDNTAPGTNPLAHSKLLSSKEGLRSMNPLSRTGYKSWHFTVDDQRIVQHLPTSEQGDHADFTGPGNQQSIGIEICVNRDGNLDVAIRRAAALVADLTNRFELGSDHVVPHQHWAQPPKGIHKACPAIFMENGELGSRWGEFLRLVDIFRKQQSVETAKEIREKDPDAQHQ